MPGSPAESVKIPSQTPVIPAPAMVVSNICIVSTVPEIRHVNWDAKIDWPMFSATPPVLLLVLPISVVI